MSDNRRNGWRNAATWTVNLWFGDRFDVAAEHGHEVTPEICRETVEEYIYSVIGDGPTGFIWDMLDLNSVDWHELAAHHQEQDPEA